MFFRRWSMTSMWTRRNLFVVSKLSRKRKFTQIASLLIHTTHSSLLEMIGQFNKEQRDKSSKIVLTLIFPNSLHRGQLTTLKLSPNCRNLPRDPKGRIIDGEPRATYEISKMSKLLSLVRDPETVTGPKTLTSTDEKQAMNVLAIMGAAKK